MVGILAFEFEPIKRKSLLKSLKGITQRLCKKNAINPADIGLMVHTGTYRQNFRQEPAFAAHLQQALDIGCANIGPTSKHTFSFDVSDGACGPHHALETIADLFPVIGCKYALLTAGDCRPNKETPWPHNPISFAAIISEDGPLQILDTRFDYEQENDFTSSTKFNKKYHTEAFTSKPHITKHRVEENRFIASSAWLCGEQLSRFVEWASSQNGTVTHRIENKNGRVSELNWRVKGE